MKSFSEIDHLGHSRHHHHTHTMHMHPIHWLEGHPMLIALLLATAIAAGVIALTNMLNTGIRPEVLDAKYPAVHPYGPTY